MTADAMPLPPIIVERDDGGYQIGWHDDAPGPFETRALAQSVADQHIKAAGAATQVVR